MSDSSRQPLPLPPVRGKPFIVKCYNPKKHSAIVSRPPVRYEYLTSPITGERVPARQIHEHMRVGLLEQPRVHRHEVKGLLPDEEKEKIGPKPAKQGVEQSHMAAAASKTQAILKAPRKPPAPKAIPITSRASHSIPSSAMTKPRMATSRTLKTPDQYTISPVTGEMVHTSQLNHHMRIALLDPRWVDQRKKHFEESAERPELARDTSVWTNLKMLAERRTDVFGVGDKETAIGWKIGEEDKKKDDKVTWDGHMSSVEAVTRTARANITIREQIRQIHHAKGLLPDEKKEKIGPHMSHIAAAASKTQAALKAPPKPPAPKPIPVPSRPPHPTPPSAMTMPRMAMSQPIMAQPPPMMMMAPMAPMSLKHPAEPIEEESPAKKLRLEDSLIPEQEFLARNKTPIQLRIVVPVTIEKAEWKLNGQTLSIKLQPSDTVATLKTRIHEQTRMPPSKQKLRFKGMFFKESNSLAYYNLASSSVISLVPKERGGRRI